MATHKVSGARRRRDLSRTNRSAAKGWLRVYATLQRASRTARRAPHGPPLSIHHPPVGSAWLRNTQSLRVRRATASDRSPFGWVSFENRGARKEHLRAEGPLIASRLDRSYQVP